MRSRTIGGQSDLRLHHIGGTSGSVATNPTAAAATVSSTDPSIGCPTRIPTSQATTTRAPSAASAAAATGVRDVSDISQGYAPGVVSLAAQRWTHTFELAVVRRGAGESVTEERKYRKFRDVHVLRIREMIADTDAAVVCPQCQGPMIIAPPIAGGTVGPFWETRCDACGLSAYVTDLPPDRRPQ